MKRPFLVEQLISFVGKRFSIFFLGNKLENWTNLLDSFTIFVKTSHLFLFFELQNAWLMHILKKANLFLHTLGFDYRPTLFCEFCFR